MTLSGMYPLENFWCDLGNGPHNQNRVKIPEHLGEIVVVLVSPIDTFLPIMSFRHRNQKSDKVVNYYVSTFSDGTFSFQNFLYSKIRYMESILVLLLKCSFSFISCALNLHSYKLQQFWVQPSYWSKPQPGLGHTLLPTLSDIFMAIS